MSSKINSLNEFIASYSHLPEQGTDEWKLLRKNFIGGSEVSTILKQNKNKTTNKLVLEKLGFDKFTGNTITHWGNIFEELIRRYCENTFKCSILETGSIPYKKGFLSYSPDGLSVISTNTLLKFFSKEDLNINTEDDSQLVLFEFKCPHSRIATHEVPEHYFPQVSIGMNIINIMETAIFVQAIFRRCSYTQLKYNTHHNGYGHFKQAVIESNPIDCGYMLLYSDEEMEYTQILNEIGETPGIIIDHDEVLDLGMLDDKYLLEEILGKCVSKEISIDYCFNYSYNQTVFKDKLYLREMYDTSLQYRANTQLKQMITKYSNKFIIGIIPYKLLSVYNTAVKKDHDYIDSTNAHNKAREVIDCINEHRGIDDRATVAKLVRKYKL